MNPWHCAPPAGARSGVADYAATLDAALEGGGTPALNLYHIGNNSLHLEIYRQALDKPGVVVLHDAVLHHFMLGHLSREQYVEEFVLNYGEWHRSVAVDLWNARVSSGTDPRYFGFPMLRRLMVRSRAVIVHNPGAASMARTHGARDVRIIPHFFQERPVPDRAATARFRQRIGVGQGTVLYGIFGYLRETKRVPSCIGVFRRLHAARPDTALLIAGEPVSPELKRLLDIEGDHPAIFRMGHLSEDVLLTAAAAIDCCLNLRYPAAGETSGIAIRMMGFGKPVILTEGEENAAFPATAALRVSAGVAESADLFDHMVMVAAFPQIGRDIGAQARGHILNNHSLDAVAREYRQVLCSAGR